MARRKINKKNKDRMYVHIRIMFEIQSWIVFEFDVGIESLKKRNHKKKLENSRPCPGANFPWPSLLISARPINLHALGPSLASSRACSPWPLRMGPTRQPWSHMLMWCCGMPSAVWVPATAALHSLPGGPRLISPSPTSHQLARAWNGLRVRPRGQSHPDAWATWALAPHPPHKLTGSRAQKNRTVFSLLESDSPPKRNPRNCW
jgi:hypothetical protein